MLKLVLLFRPRLKQASVRPVVSVYCYFCKILYFSVSVADFSDLRYFEAIKPGDL
jgi:hypothetical protein